MATFEEIAPAADEMGRRIRSTMLLTPWVVAEQRPGGTVTVTRTPADIASEQDIAGRWTSRSTSIPDHRGRGIGRLLYDALLPLLRRQGFVNVYAGIAIPNVPSVSLHEHVGMRWIGIYEHVGFKFGAWHDVAWYGLRLVDLAASPVEPVPYPVPPDLPELPAKRVLTLDLPEGPCSPHGRASADRSLRSPERADDRRPASLPRAGIVAARPCRPRYLVRSYRIGQVDDARLIARLRELELGLAEIGTVDRGGARRAQPSAGGPSGRLNALLSKTQRQIHWLNQTIDHEEPIMPAATPATIDAVDPSTAGRRPVQQVWTLLERTDRSTAEDDDHAPCGACVPPSLGRGG